MTSRFPWMLALAVVGLVVAPSLWAQQTVPGAAPAAPAAPGVPAPAPPTTPPEATAAPTSEEGALQASPRLDHLMARWLSLGNQREVTLGQFAQQRASSDAVKKFAQDMIKDHSEFGDRLQQVAQRFEQNQQMVQQAMTAAPSGSMQEMPSVGAPLPPETAQSGPIGSGQPYRAGYRGGGLPGTPALTLAQQVGDRTTKLVQDELGKRQGVQFDAAYIGQQINQHLEILAALETFEQHATPEFKQVISQGVQATERHLNDARNLMNQLQQQIAATAQHGAPGSAPEAPRPR